MRVERERLEAEKRELAASLQAREETAKAQVCNTPARFAFDERARFVGGGGARKSGGGAFRSGGGAQAVGGG
eukprot:6714726-Pyramimonas_sp.AAC.1